MNVFFDISAVGSSVGDMRARTGVTRYVESLFSALKTNTSVTLNLCASWNPANCIQSRLLAADGRLPPLSPVRLPRNILLRGLIKAQEPFHRALSGWAGAGKLPVIMNKPLNPFFTNAAPMGIEEADVFHSTFFPVAGKWGGTSRVLTVYDLIPIKYPQFFEKSLIDLMKQVYRSTRYCDQVITISNSTKRDLCDYIDIAPELVTVTPLAASDMFRPCDDAESIARARTRYGIPEDPYLLSLCTLEPRKNIHQAVRAFVALVNQERIKDLNLVLVGTLGWGFDQLFREIKGAGALRERIIMTGFVEDQYLAPLYSAAMAFVYPSIYEGFGLPPLEAMQCGIPVITSNTSSMPEVVGKAGIMVDPEDTVGLSQAMLDIYRKSELRNELSRASISRAAEFSWARCAAQTANAYRAARQQ